MIVSQKRKKTLLMKDKRFIKTVIWAIHCKMNLWNLVVLYEYNEEQCGIFLDLRNLLINFEIENENVLWKTFLEFSVPPVHELDKCWGFDYW